MQLVAILGIGVVFAPALPLTTPLLFAAAISSCMLAVASSRESFQVYDDAGIARAGIRCAVLWSMIVNALLFLD